ncbi:hypothetical protein [Acuticoccus kandeliae]|uniref:hypothetical protein n=1 Tax=Acuticoccus kandeliae TaxID=2073160 RepID=UPI000D3E16BB|nr:hypothetical protein [Acuticoccus kandeliae]
MSVPVAYAQDAFDESAAVETFLTDAGTYGATSATVGSVTSEGDVVKASDVNITWSTSFEAEGETVTIDATLTMPAVEIEGLAKSGEGYTVARLLVPDANFKVTTEGAEAPFEYDISVTDYEVVNAIWGAFPVIQANATAPISRFAPLVDWSVKQSYDSSSVGKISGTTTIAGDTQQMSYGPVKIGPVVNGVLERFEYGPIETTQTTEIPGADGVPTPMEISISYGASRGEGLDLRPVAAFLTGTDAADGPQTVIGRTELDGMTASGGDLFKMSIGKNLLENVTVDPSGTPLMASLDKVVLAFQSGEEPNPQELINLMMDVYGAFGIGKYSMSDVSVSSADVTAALGNIEIDGLSSAGLDLLSINGLEVNTLDGAGSLGTFELADFVFPAREAFMNAMIANMMGMPPDLQTTMGAVPYLGRLTVKDLDLKTLGGDVKVGLFENKLEDYIAPIPTSISIELQGLEMPAAMLPDPQSAMMLQMMQADPVKADGTIKLRWDEDTQRVELDKDITIGGVGQIQAAATLSGIPRFIFENPMRANEAVATAAVNSVNATFSDGGVTGFLLGMISEQAGVPMDQFVQGIAQQISVQAGMLTGDEQFGAQIGDAISTYLSDPQTLSISASPAAPVAVAQIIGAAMTAPQALPGLLNFSISANE